MNTLVDRHTLDELLRKFFDGETTCAQERLLEKYFTSGGEIPAEYECYREMFGWYASGMDESKLPSPENKSHRSPRMVRFFVWSASVAAAIALIIGIGWNNRVEKITTGTSPYYGSYIVRDGRTITGNDEIISDVQATLIEGQCLDAEIDMLMAIENEQINIPVN